MTQPSPAPFINCPHCEGHGSTWTRSPHDFDGSNAPCAFGCDDGRIDADDRDYADAAYYIGEFAEVLAAAIVADRAVVYAVAA